MCVCVCVCVCVCACACVCVCVCVRVFVCRGKCQHDSKITFLAAAYICLLDMNRDPESACHVAPKPETPAMNGCAKPSTVMLAA